VLRALRNVGNCRRLPPRKFSKCTHNNEIHRVGRGVQTHEPRSLTVQGSW
jgi:hypothetical protein